MSSLHRARHARTPAPGQPGAFTLASAAFAETLINAMEAKNAYLRGHSQRVADLAASIAEALGLPEEVVEQVRLAGRLHDIGKIGIREAVLDKPGPLDGEEYAHVQDHVRIGLEILAPMRDLGPVLAFISDHHERLDGSGYPRGIAGESISLGGRIIAAADMFDALRSRRAYRDSLSEEATVAYMARLSGTALFPDIFAALRHVVEQRQSLVFLGEMRAPAEHVENAIGGSVTALPDRATLGTAISDSAAAALTALVNAIAELPSAERLALTLRYLENLSDAEIACLTEFDQTTARTLRRSGLRRIAQTG